MNKTDIIESIKNLAPVSATPEVNPPAPAKPAEPTMQDVVAAMQQTFGELRQHAEALQANHNALVQTTAMMAELITLQAPNSELARTIMARFTRNAE